MAQASTKKTSKARPSTRSTKTKTSRSGDISKTLKKRLENLSVTVVKAEKNAEKQVQKILKFTDKYKRDQLKKVRELISEARKINSKDLVQRAEKIRTEIEKKANSGMKNILKTLEIPSKKEIDQLKSRIVQLETELRAKDSSEKTPTSSAASN